MTKKSKTTPNMCDRLEKLEAAIKLQKVGLDDLVKSCSSISESLHLLTRLHKNLQEKLFKPIK